MIQTTAETITYAIAGDLLQKNLTNRPIRRTTVRQYAKAMERGEWVFNGESIKLGDDGSLIDGQHRLRAVQASGVPIKTLVVRGLPTSVFATLDTGAKRSAGDTLALMGNKYTSFIAAACRPMMVMDGLIQNLSHSVTNTQILECFERHPLIGDWAARFGNSPIKKFLGAQAIAVFVGMEELWGPVSPTAFFEQLAEGVGLRKDDPAYALRERFIGTSTKNRLSADFRLALTIKAANAFANGRKVGLLRYGSNEQFPVLARES